jgi:murein DD-endopeptidase MepM/ murein hydrolase activator NlpD
VFGVKHGTSRYSALPTGFLRRGPALAVLAAATAVVVLAGPALADPSDEKARVDRDLARTAAALEAANERVAAAAKALANAESRLPAATERVARAQGELAGAHARANTAARALARANADLTRAGLALDAANAEVERTRDEIGRYSAVAYMGRDIAGIDALLAIESPAQLAAALMYMERIGDSQQHALDSVNAAHVDAANKQNEVRAKKAQAEAAQAEADAALRDAQLARQQAQRAQDEVTALIAQRENALKVAEQERDATEQRYRELQAESERIAAEIRALARDGGPVLRPGARLPMPVNGWKSSDFGMRFDPFYHVWRLHAGIDLAAAGGSPIWAVEAGRVFRAGWSGGYGNYTCIYHGRYSGKGFASCYAHQSVVLVAAGQQVRQGQVIGRVGTTGASTGNHLHFEIRLDGTPVDPVPWLPSCLC